MKENIVEYFGLDPSMIEVIPTGVDTDLFNPDTTSSKLRQKYNLNDDVSVIMCVASIERRKNQLALAKAVAKIVAIIPDVMVMFVGRITDQTYFAEIQGYMKTNRLQDRVIFTEHIDPQLLPQYYNLCDVFVLPSLAEGLPLVLLEAMSCCKAIVASALPQYIEVAKHGDEFLVVDSLDPDTLSQAILSILKNEEWKIRLELSARRAAAAFFDWKKVSISTAELYKSLQDYHHPSHRHTYVTV